MLRHHQQFSPFWPTSWCLKFYWMSDLLVANIPQTSPTTTTTATLTVPWPVGFAADKKEKGRRLFSLSFCLWSLGRLALLVGLSNCPLSWAPFERPSFWGAHFLLHRKKKPQGKKSGGPKKSCLNIEHWYFFFIALYFSFVLKMDGSADV